MNRAKRAKTVFFAEGPLFGKWGVRPGSWAAYLVAVAIVGAATALQVAPSPWLVGTLFAPFYPAVIVISFLCGASAGFFAIALSAATVTVFMPAEALSQHAYSLGIYGLFGTVVVVIISELRTAVTRVDRLNTSLSANEAKFRSLMESAPDAMVIKGVDGSILLVNAQAERLFGYERHELVGQPVVMLAPERYRAAYTAKRLSVAEWPLGAQVQSEEFRGLRKDGSEFPVEIVLSSVLAEDGIYSCATIRDITQRKFDEEALRYSEMRYRTLVENTTDLITLEEAHEKGQYVSPACRKMLGYEAQEMIASTGEALIHPDDLAGCIGARDSLSKERPQATSTHRLRRKDGSFAWVEAVFNWIEEGFNGQPQILSVIRDISDRKAAEDAASKARAEAKRTEALLIDTIDAPEEGIALYDSEDRLVLLNKAIDQNPAGRTGLFVPGRTYEEIFRAFWSGSDLAKDKEAFERIVADEIERHQRGDGAPNEVRVGKNIWVVNRDFRTRDGGILHISTNVSALMLAKEAAEQANVAKSRFLAAASHDLRQPLQSIALLQAGLKQTATDPQSQSMIERLGATVDSMSHMLDTLLELNQLEAGIVTPNIEDIAIGDLLERLRAELLYHAEAKGLEFRFIQCGAVVRSDPKLLEQIIRNLLSNAIKYTNRGKILLGCRRRGDAVRIEVLDTGVGIPKDQIQAIFDEFHQVDNPARDRRKGLGLGLSITQRLSDLLGHRIHVRSVLNKGSVFSVEVPLGQPLAPASAHPDESAASAEPMDILLVEDDPIVRWSLQALLEVLGHGVVSAENAERALARLREADWRPDVIVSDFNLPGSVDGLELIKQTRIQLGASIPAVLLTGDSSMATDAALSIPDCTLLRKPADGAGIIAAAQLRRAVRSAAPPIPCEA